MILEFHGWLLHRINSLFTLWPQKDLIWLLPCASYVVFGKSTWFELFFIVLIPWYTKWFGTFHQQIKAGIVFKFNIKIMMTLLLHTLYDCLRAKEKNVYHIPKTFCWGNWVLELTKAMHRCWTNLNILYKKILCRFSTNLSANAAEMIVGDKLFHVDNKPLMD